MQIHPETAHQIVAGCDEVGRGCLAGPVCAAAVILPRGFCHESIRDSKKITSKLREELYNLITQDAISYAIAYIDNIEIDRINILQASLLAMHHALDNLIVRPTLILADGNRFNHYHDIPHQCIIKGDDTYYSIAAASILAKVARDRYMTTQAHTYPHYAWENNKGYPTKAHRKAIATYGKTPLHRNSFKVTPISR